MGAGREDSSEILLDGNVRGLIYGPRPLFGKVELMTRAQVSKLWMTSEDDR